MGTFVYNSQLDAFTLYHQVQEDSAGSKIGDGPGLPALGHAVSGATGTALANILIYPLDTIITRLQVQDQPDKAKTTEQPDYEGIVDAAQKIYEREGGIGAFYSGCTYDTAKNIADSFLFFLAYNFLRSARRNAHNGSKSLPVQEELLVGMLAGAFGKFFTTPIQQVVTRKQTAAPGTSKSLQDIMLGIKKEKGIQGFWSGYSATIILTLNPSLTFLFHGLFLKAFVPRAKRDNPGPWLTFFLAAASKGLASTITYPFSLAKTRAQVSPKTTEETIEAGHDSKAGGKITEKLNKAALRQLTIFTSLVRVAQTEGIAALYHGVGAEVTKGFLKHGLTMLMKERIHVVVIQLYYLILKALRKYPTPEELAGRVAKKGSVTFQQASEATEKAYQTAKEGVVQMMQDSVETNKSLLWGVVDEDE